MIKALKTAGIAWLIAITLFTSCSDENQPVVPDNNGDTVRTMTGTWHIPLDESWRLKISQYDSLLYGEYIKGQSEMPLEGTVSTDRVVSIAILGQNNFPDGVVADLVIDGQVNEEYDELTGVLWYRNRATGDAILYWLFNAVKLE